MSVVGRLKLKVYTKGIVMGLTALIGVIASFGLPVTPEQQLAILATAPFIGTVLVVWLPNRAD